MRVSYQVRYSHIWLYPVPEMREGFSSIWIIYRDGGDIFSLKEILGHTTLDMVSHYLHFTSSQITAQHHKYSPMDKLQSEVEVGAI